MATRAKSSRLKHERSLVDEHQPILPRPPWLLSIRRLAYVEALPAVPDDWFIVICDLRDSTEAIEAGLYQDVNLMGAACISTMKTAITDDFPFVFGGDGASLLLPDRD